MAFSHRRLLLSFHPIVLDEVLTSHNPSMALRLLSKKLVSHAVPKWTAAPRALGTAAAPSASDPLPTVFDKLISLTIVDPSGARRKIPAMVGKCRCQFFFIISKTIVFGDSSDLTFN